MELDRNYFNSIRLSTHRGKYYDVEAVDRLLVDIRSRADALNREVLAARDKVAELERTNESLQEENSELFLKGQALSQEILALREELRAAHAGEASLIPEKEAGEIPAEEAVPPDEEFYFLTEELPDPRKQEAPEEPEEEAPDEEPEEISDDEPAQGSAAAGQTLEEAEREAQEILARAGRERERILLQARAEREKTVERMERVFAMLKEISTYTIEKSERVHEEFLQAVAGQEDAPQDLTEKIGRIAAQLNEMDGI